MSVWIYDTALIKKLQAWTRNTNIHIYGPNDTKTLFQVIEDQTRDKPIELPIVTLRRSGGFQILNINKQPKTFDGLMIQSNEHRTLQINAIPININYQLDIYTRYLRQADEYCRNFIFNIVNYPHIEIELPYNDCRFRHSATIRVGQNVQDNSGIAERLVPGQFTRLTLNINIDDAYLWDAKILNNVTIDDQFVILKE